MALAKEKDQGNQVAAGTMITIRFLNDVPLDRLKTGESFEAQTAAPVKGNLEYAFGYTNVVHVRPEVISQGGRTIVSLTLQSINNKGQNYPVVADPVQQILSNNPGAANGRDEQYARVKAEQRAALEARLGHPMASPPGPAQPAASAAFSGLRSHTQVSFILKQTLVVPYSRSRQ